MTNRQKCYENLAFISDVFKKMSIDVLNKEIIDDEEWNLAAKSLDEIMHIIKILEHNGIGEEEYKPHIETLAEFEKKCILNDFKHELDKKFNHENK